MSVPQVIVAITGGLLQHIPLRDNDTLPSLDLIQLWLRAGCLVLCESSESRMKPPSSPMAREAAPRWRVLAGIETIEGQQCLRFEGDGHFIGHAELLTECTSIYLVRSALIWKETVLHGVVGDDGNSERDSRLSALSPMRAAGALVSGARRLSQRLLGSDASPGQLASPETGAEPPAAADEQQRISTASSVDERTTSMARPRQRGERAASWEHGTRRPQAAWRLRRWSECGG